MIQTLIVIAVVGACAAWALRKAWNWWSGRGRCGCDHCPVSHPRK